MTWRQRLRHAFAVDDSDSTEPTPEQRPAVERFCRAVARRRLTTPGLIALEMGRPLNFLAAQALHFASPGVWALTRQGTYDDYVQFTGFLERRGATEHLARRIEHYEKLFEQQERRPGRGPQPEQAPEPERHDTSDP